MGTQAQPFQYQALRHPREIRLLRVSWNQKLNRISCTFCHLLLSLDKILPRYQAISYCWDDPTAIERIWITENEYLDIPESAASVLEYLIATENHGFIWIDAICINQTNIEERGQQVRLMRDIYSSATRVIAWVGKSSKDSDLVMKFLSNVARKIEILERKRSGSGELSMVQMRRVLPHWSDPGWEALRNLIDRPWFGRLWIVQEIVMARQRSPACGTTPIAHWDELINILEYLDRTGLSVHFLMIPTEVEGIRSPIGSGKIQLIAQYGESFGRGHLSGIQHLLGSFYTSKTTDPRDKIFGLWGMANDVGDSVFNPDYESVTQDLFTKVCLYLLMRDEYLELLHSAGLGAPRALVELPSWVPDWSQTEIYNPYSIFHKIEWRAGGVGSRMSTKTNLPCQNAIAVSGLVLDSVNIFTEQYPISFGVSWEEYRKGASKVVRWFQNWVDIVGGLNPYPTTESCYEVYWRSILCNLTNIMDQATPEFSDHHQRQSGRSSAGYTTFAGALSYTRQRLLFITTNGYAGKGPIQNISIGAKFCIFYGAKTPFIIRPNPSHEGQELTYTLIGDCYVHGLMHGEGLGMGVTEDIMLV